MQAKVTRKSQYGFQIEGQDGWVNYGKYYKGTKEFNVGDLIEYEAKQNGEYTNLVSLRVVTASAPTAHAATASVSATASKNEPSVRSEIARGTAVKAVFNSPSLANAYRDADVSETLQELKDLTVELTNYILTGQFKAAVLEQTNGK